MGPLTRVPIFHSQVLFCEQIELGRDVCIMGVGRWGQKTFSTCQVSWDELFVHILSSGHCTSKELCSLTYYLPVLEAPTQEIPCKIELSSLYDTYVNSLKFNSIPKNGGPSF